MRRRITVGSSLAALVLTLSAAAGEPVKSGPQVGEKCTPFAPLNVTGRFAGEERCLV